VLDAYEYEGYIFKSDIVANVFDAYVNDVNVDEA
jgi:hypothetical protein